MMKPETITQCFLNYLDGLSGVSARSKALVLREAEKRTRNRELTGCDSDITSQSLYLGIIRAEIIEEHWDQFEPDERIALCFPSARQVGETAEIPNRGKGTILWRKLTRRQGLEIGFRMEDGTMFTWEFFD